MEEINPNQDTEESNFSYFEYDDENQGYDWTHFYFTIALCCIYAIIFIFGFAGNLWVLCNIVRIFKVCSFKKNRAFFNITGKTNKNNASGENKPNLKIHFTTVIYMFVLSVVDILVLSNVPFLIGDLLFNNWLFGFHLCKFYWTVDTVNKVLSIFILTLMSFERYSVVCKFRACNPCFRTAKGTVFILTVVCFVVVLITCPIYTNGTLSRIGQYYEADNKTVILEDFNKCTLDLTEDEAAMLTLLIFSIGFCGPSLLIAFFYGRILMKLRSHSRSLRSLVSQIPVKKVTCTVLTLVLTYFFCWTPFWFVNVYSTLNAEFGKANDIRKVYIVQATNLLVYLNSALNWIVYTYLNGNFKDIRKSINRSELAKTSQVETTKLLDNSAGVRGQSLKNQRLLQHAVEEEYL